MKFLKFNDTLLVNAECISDIKLDPVSQIISIEFRQQCDSNNSLSFNERDALNQGYSSLEDMFKSLTESLL